MGLHHDLPFQDQRLLYRLFVYRGPTSTHNGLIGISFFGRRAACTIFCGVQSSTNSTHHRKRTRGLPFYRKVQKVFRHEQARGCLHKRVFPLRLLHEGVSRRARFSFRTVLRGRPTRVFSVYQGLSSTLCSICTRRTSTHRLSVHLKAILRSFLRHLR